MATSYSPKIITDGLVLALDAGDIKSYPGTGTTWKDRSGNALNGTLLNSPTFSGANKGDFSFDATNESVSIAETSILMHFGLNARKHKTLTGCNSYSDQRVAEIQEFGFT